MLTFEETLSEFHLTSEEHSKVYSLLDSQDDVIIEVHQIRFRNKITVVPRVPDQIDEDWHLGDRLLYLIKINQEVFWIDFASDAKQEVEQLEALWSR